MNQPLSNVCRICVLTAWAIALTACGGPGIGLDAVPMPEADLVGQVDPQAMRETPFWDAVADLAERQSAGVGDSTWEQLAFVRQIMKSSELTFDDILEVRLAAQVTGERVQAVTGFRFDRPLSPETAVSAMEALAEEYRHPVMIGEVEHPAGTVLRVEMQDGQRLPPVFIAFAPGETVVFQGSEKAVLGAMDRIESGRASEPSPELARVTASVDPEAQAWLAYTVSGEQRETITGLLGVDDIPAPLQGLVDSLDSFTSVVTEIRATENMEVRVSWLFDGTDDAESFHTSMTGLTELLKGVVALASGGRPIDAVNSMVLTRTELAVLLDLTISQNDLFTLEELYELNLTE